MKKDEQALTWHDLPLPHFRKRRVDFALIEDNPVFLLSARRMKRSRWLFLSYINPIVLGLIISALIHTYYIWLLPLVVLIYILCTGTYSEAHSFKRMFGFHQRDMLQGLFLTPMSMRTAVMGRIALWLTGRRVIQSGIFALTLAAYYGGWAWSLKSTSYYIVIIALIACCLLVWIWGMDVIIIGFHYWICQAVWYNCKSSFFKRLSNFMTSGCTGCLIVLMFGGLIIFFSMILFGVTSAILKIGEHPVVWQTLPLISGLILLILLYLQGSSGWRANMQYCQGYCYNVLYMIVMSETPQYNPYVHWLGTRKR